MLRSVTHHHILTNFYTSYTSSYQLYCSPGLGEMTAYLYFPCREGLVTKRSGGHRRVTNCLGCTACCVCRYSVWQQRWGCKGVMLWWCDSVCRYSMWQQRWGCEGVMLWWCDSVCRYSVWQQRWGCEGVMLWWCDSVCRYSVWQQRWGCEGVMWWCDSVPWLMCFCLTADGLC